MEFAVAEAPERDGRITKHSTLLKTIIEITGFPRNSAVAEFTDRVGYRLQNIVHYLRLLWRLP